MMRSKMMKHCTVLLAAVMVFLLAACGKKSGAVDAQALLDRLLTEVTYDAELTQVGKRVGLYLPELPENSEITMYRGSGYSADEVALVTVRKEADAAQAQKAMEKHLSELRDQFQNYAPEELPKIDHAIIWQTGTNLFLCVTNDYARAQAILTGGASAPAQKPDNNQPSTDEPLTMPTQPTPAEPEAPAEPEVPEVPAEQAPAEYPKLQSQSGTYHDYGTFVIRVDDKAYEQYGYVDSAAQAYADIVNQVADQLAGVTTVYDLAIPTASGIVLPDDIAAKLSTYTNQGEALDKIFAKMSKNVVPVHCYDNLMQHRDEELYFHTDYHWNGRGAYYAYEAFCKVKGVTPVTLEERKKVTFDNFLGQLYWNGSKEDPILKANPDTVEAYYPKSQSATMEYTDQKGQTFSWPIISDVTDWPSSTKYSTFAGADNPMSVFHNPEVTDGSVCVVVKESYGNALMPYLVDHYSTIYEIDYRYWNGDLVSFTKEKQADDLIFANNLSMIGSNYLIGELAKIVK